MRGGSGAQMEKLGVPLLVHGEVTDPAVDIFDREAVFIDTVLTPLLRDFPALKVVLEHITTRERRRTLWRMPAPMSRRPSPHIICCSIATRCLPVACARIIIACPC
jgi:dihydroorotase